MPWKKPVIFNQFDAPQSGGCPVTAYAVTQAHPTCTVIETSWILWIQDDTGISRSEKISVKNHGKPQYPLALRFVAGKIGKSPIELQFSQL